MAKYEQCGCFSFALLMLKVDERRQAAGLSPLAENTFRLNAQQRHSVWAHVRSGLAGIRPDGGQRPCCLQQLAGDRTDQGTRTQLSENTVSQALHLSFARLIRAQPGEKA